MASGRTGMALGQIQRLFDEGTLTGLTDAQFVDRFLNRRDEAAFAALVERHGPMVLAVCRGVLKNQADAEDAFQATFFVLFRKAGGLRSVGSLGSWLYRVAYRIALRANAVSARRRQRFREEDVMAAEAASSGEPEVDRELLPIIHAEIDRLPDKYRAPIALCYLEGLSYEQAAHQLGWPLGTVGSRIARARELLRSRLTRRGITATTAALSALLASEGHAAPAGWVEAATRAAMALGAADGAKSAGAVSAAVALSDQVLRRMLMIRLIQMISLLAVVGTAGWLGWASVGAVGRPGGLDAPAPVVEAPANPAAGEAKKDPAGQGPIRGRVLAPDGRPVRGAAIYVGRLRAFWFIDPVARTGADGRFLFGPEDVSRQQPKGADPLDWKKLDVTATAPGYGAARVQPANADGGDVELRLVPDDVTIRGRVLDMQGRPVAGVTVNVQAIEDPTAGNLDALLEYGLVERDRYLSGLDAAWHIKEGTNWARKKTRTGPDGRFRVEGAGRDRLVFLEFEGPGISKGHLCAMTRVAPPSDRPRPAPADRDYLSRVDLLQGATFDYVATPSRTIEGVVRARDTGRPMAGVRVSGFAQENRALVNVVTDQEGRFRLEGLPKVASYQVSASPWPKHPYLPASAKISDTEGLKPISVTLDLLKGISVRVRLIDKATGKSVPGYSVSYVKMPSNPNKGDATAVASNFGPEGFPMTVPPGPGFFYARANGENLPYTRARLRPADRGKGIGGETDEEPLRVILSPCHAYGIVYVPANADNFPVDLELTRGASRKGRLIDPDGKPIVGVQAYGLASNWEVQTLDGATFEATALEPGNPRSLSFMHKDRRLAGAIELEPGDGPVEVRLEPCGAAVGRLVDADGQPHAGASIILLPLAHRGDPIPGGVHLWPQGRGFSTDRDGRFRFEWINPALGVAVDVRPRSRPDVFLVPEKPKEATFRHLKTRPGETVDLGEIRMTRRPNG